jgi:hypothetical protein
LYATGCTPQAPLLHPPAGAQLTGWHTGPQIGRHGYGRNSPPNGIHCAETGLAVANNINAPSAGAKREDFPIMAPSC